MSIEKLEYRCTTRNLRLCNGTIIVLKISLLHSVSVITNFVIPKCDKQTDKKTSHLFVYSRRATHDPHHTWHVDRGGPYHFCIPITFLIRAIVSPLGLGAIEMKFYGKMTPQWENTYNLVVCPPKVTNLKTWKLPMDAYKIWQFRKIVQTSDPWGANLWPKFEILTVLGAVFSHFCPNKREIWHGERTEVYWGRNVGIQPPKLS